jgi:hypothetical protein
MSRGADFPVVTTTRWFAGHHPTEDRNAERTGPGSSGPAEIGNPIRDSPASSTRRDRLRFRTQKNRRPTGVHAVLALASVALVPQVPENHRGYGTLAKHGDNREFTRLFRLPTVPPRAPPPLRQYEKRLLIAVAAVSTSTEPVHVAEAALTNHPGPEANHVPRIPSSRLSSMIFPTVGGEQVMPSGPDMSCLKTLARMRVSKALIGMSVLPANSCDAIYVGMAHTRIWQNRPTGPPVVPSARTQS